MATVSKVLLRSAVYATPQGVLHATPSRVKAWADRWREMDAAGIKIPVSYGHQPDAWPLDPRGASDRARQQYHLSAFNAGYLGGMDFDGQQLNSRLDCPGLELDGDNLVCWRRLPDGTEVKTAVGEVSVAVKDWTDGTGRVWPDSIVHVALTPLPVAHGTGGFSLSVCDGDGAAVTLSLSSMLYQLSTEGDMAEETKKDDGAAGGGGKDYFSEGMEFLKRKGIALPDDTTPENFWERVVIAGHALENADETPELDDLDETADDTGETEPDADDGATYTGEGDGGTAGATEEQRPVMMSLSTAKTPAERGSLKMAGDAHKARLAGRIKRLVKKGLIRPALRADLERDLAGYEAGFTLSAAGDMSAVSKRLDQRISDLELSLIGPHPLKGLATAAEARRPGGRSADEARKAQEAAGDELAALAGAAPRK